MAVSSITGKKKATTVAKNTGNSSGSQVSSIGTQSRVLRNAPTPTKSTSGSMSWNSKKNSSNRNTFAKSSIGSGFAGSPKKTSGGSLSFSDRIKANNINNGIVEQDTPEIPGLVQPTPTTDNTETLDLAKTYMGGDAEGISSPEDSSWAGVDRGSGLTQEELLAQDKANLEAQQLALQDEENNKFAIDQGKLIEDNAKQKKYMQDQEALSLEAKDIQNQNTEIQNEQQITQTQTQLHNLKQNIGFLGQMGQPGVAAAALDAVDRQLYQAGDIFKNLLKQVSNNRAISSIGEKVNANQFAKQIQDLQDNLDSQVSKVVQDAFNKIVMLDGDGKLDTMDEVVALKREILGSVDTSIEGITMGNIQQRQNAIDHYTQLIEDQQLVIENAQKVNTEMSSVKGYYVDGNGNAIVDVSTGQPIPMPEVPPMEPIFDKESGNLITFSYDENGGIVANVNKVMDVPKGANEWKLNTTSGEYYRTNDNGELEIKGDDGNPEPVSTQNNPFNPDNTSNLILSGNVTELAESMEYDTPYECTDASGRGTECGEWYNDAVGIKNGTRVGNEYGTKTQFIDYSVTQGNAGDGVVFNRDGGEYGHIGVLASGIYSNNGEIGYDVISSNLNNEGKLTKSFVTEAEIANTGGGFIPTTATESKKEQTTNTQSRKQLEDEVLGLTIGLGGTEGERKQLQKTIVDYAVNNGVSVREAKAELGYKTAADMEFTKNMNEQYDVVRKKVVGLDQVKGAIRGLDNPNATTDLIAIVGLLKSIDPTSVARSDEVANVENARSILDTYANKWEKLKSGKKLTDTQRQDIKNAMQTQVDVIEGYKNEFISDVSSEYEQRGLNPKDLFVAGDYERATKPTSTTTTAPTIPQQTTPSTQFTPEQESELERLYNEA